MWLNVNALWYIVAVLSLYTNMWTSSSVTDLVPVLRVIVLYEVKSSEAMRGINNITQRCYYLPFSPDIHLCAM
jgi:hypothetical protein